MNESRLECLKEELKDEDYRYAYAEDFLNTWVATQIVALREQRGLSQTELGELIGTKQPGVSRLENVNHSTWKTETLKRIARALGVRLKISFETFGSLLDDDAGFNRRFLQRPTFEGDPVFQERKTPLMASVSVPFTGYSAETKFTREHHEVSAPAGGRLLVMTREQTTLPYTMAR